MPDSFSILGRLGRARDLLVRQRAQLINALRGLAAEHGWVVPRVRFRMARLMADIEDPACALPEAARAVFLVMIDAIRVLDARILAFDREIAGRAKRDPDARRLVAILGTESVSVAPGGSPLNEKGPALRGGAFSIRPGDDRPRNRKRPRREAGPFVVRA